MECFLCITVSENVLWFSSTEHKALVGRVWSVTSSAALPSFFLWLPTVLVVYVQS